ncbi:MAG: hypothetical protein LBQ52_06580 [Helicobacteraceae bacterium]|nr:hypothetical protein [Helicobacteraceae bacterium]
MENYIDLELKKINGDKSNDRIYNLTQAILEHNLVIILGNPGSGKTSILKKYQQEYENVVHSTTAKSFIKLNESVRDSAEILLIDAVDEYRTVSNDKTFVFVELGRKLNEIIKRNNSLRIVISCREMDWYGIDDKQALRNEIKIEAYVYQILPLSYELQDRFADHFKIKNKNEFLYKFQQFDFLDNPYLFKMLSDIWESGNENSIETKSKIYETFISNARERKREYNEIDIEKDKMFKIVGYIALFHIFSEKDIFNEEFVDEIADSKNGYLKDDITKVLKTKLFNERAFAHRTIAEYALAHFINASQNSNNISFHREKIKTLFVKNEKIPTPLKGTYSWLCAFSKDSDLIKIDPYYQVVYGDASLFNYEQKREAIEAVKIYLKEKDPSCVSYGHVKEIGVLYCEELDDFLIQEFKEYINSLDHYTSFLAWIISYGKNPSSKIKNFAKERLAIKNERVYFPELITPIRDDISFLKQLLIKIRNNEIEDKGHDLKDRIMRVLYPEHINTEELVEYLATYEGDQVVGHCWYLFKTKYKDKYALIDELYKKLFDDAESYFKNSNIKYFIEDYFAETMLQFEDTMSAKDIFDILIHFKSYYKKREALKFNSLMQKDKLDKFAEKLQRLASELFGLYVEKMIDEKAISKIDDFRRFIEDIPSINSAKIIFEKMDKDLSEEELSELFWQGFYNLPLDKRNNDEIKALLKRYKLEDILYKLENPSKSAWEIEQEKENEERIEKIKKCIRAKERYFSEKDDKTIQKTLNDLAFIAWFYYHKLDDKIDECLTKSTQARLKDILKDVIYFEPLSEEPTSIHSLLDSKRNSDIDQIYYISLCLNENINIDGIVNEEFLRYLYILSVLNEPVRNICHNTFTEQIENDFNDFAIDALKRYIGLLLTSVFDEVKANILSSFIEKEDNKEALKNIIWPAYNNKKNSILNRLLRYYAFKMSPNDLENLIEIDIDDDNKLLIETLLLLQNNKKEDFRSSNASALCDLLDINKPDYDANSYLSSTDFSSQDKIKIVDYLFTGINTVELKKSVEEFRFGSIRKHTLDLLNISELQELLKTHGENSIWHNDILNKMNALMQQASDSEFSAYSVEKIKKYIFNQEIISKEDFFTDLCIKLDEVKTIIEDNRANDKDAFYNKKESKDENACRDEILRILKHRHDHTLDFSKESYEANNRVDINVRYKHNLSFEAQIECKKDGNQDIYNAIKDQLIKKYFSSGVQFGIYLIFYFGDRQNKTKMIEKIKNYIPENYINAIKIICIDLTKK